MDRLQFKAKSDLRGELQGALEQLESRGFKRPEPKQEAVTLRKSLRSEQSSVPTQGDKPSTLEMMNLTPELDCPDVRNHLLAPAPGQSLAKGLQVIGVRRRGGGRTLVEPWELGVLIAMGMVACASQRALSQGQRPRRARKEPAQGRAA